MEENQATLKTEERDFYKCVKSHTKEGFVKELNKAQKEGYRPIWDSREITRDNGSEPATVLRTVMVYDTEAEPIETDPMELEIIEALDMAEGYLIETTTSLADEKNRLLIDTDYDIVNAERHEKGLPAVKTAPEKKAWVDNQLSQRTLDAKEATRWKKYVEAMAKRGELPQRESPWERKAREAEEQAQIEDEQSSEVYVEKVGSEPMAGDVDG